MNRASQRCGESHGLWAAWQNDQLLEIYAKLPYRELARLRTQTLTSKLDCLYRWALSQTD
jgi:hypothetical protein